jgi:hypothetical protein
MWDSCGESQAEGWPLGTVAGSPSLTAQFAETTAAGSLWQKEEGRGQRAEVKAPAQPAPPLR